MQKSVRIAVLSMAVAALGSVARAQELVTNGGFESGSSLTGWTVTGNTTSNCSTTASSTAGIARTGSWHLRMGPVNGTCTISQTIATTAGQSYTFSFWLSIVTTAGGNSFSAFWDGVSQYSVTNVPLQPYVEQQFTVTASAPSTTIAFTSQFDDYWFRVDDVSVTALATTVPEPSSYALMAAGLLGIAVARRRRRG